MMTCSTGRACFLFVTSMQTGDTHNSRHIPSLKRRCGLYISSGRAIETYRLRTIRFRCGLWGRAVGYGIIWDALAQCITLLVWAWWYCGVSWVRAQRSVCAERARWAKLCPLPWKRCNVLPIHVFHSACRGSLVHARLRPPGWREPWGVASQNSVFRLLDRDRFAFFLHFSVPLVVPLSLRFHLDLVYYVPFGVERSCVCGVRLLFCHCASL